MQHSLIQVLMAWSFVLMVDLAVTYLFFKTATRSDK